MARREHAWWTPKVSSSDPLTALVRVMAQVEGWAMVRRPGCVPFVVPVKELKPAEQKEPGND